MTALETDSGSVDAALERDAASWRDPRGFVFRRGGRVYRQIGRGHAGEWTAFAGSDFARGLVDTGRLLPWADAPLDARLDDSAWAVIQPEQLDFIAYPYEWTFGQLRDAALLTLDIQSEALAAGFSLRDASAYNVQFRGVRPTLIDHLSFERAVPDAPWIAYRQFCEHFLAPLSLMAWRDVRMGRMLRDQLDGIPLDLAARLLPGRTRLRLGLGSHVHLHARAQRQHADDGARTSSARAGSDGTTAAGGEGSTTTMGSEGSTTATNPGAPRLSAGRLKALLRGLRETVAGLRWDPSGTEWADYADQDHASYQDAAHDVKAQTTAAMLDAVGGRRAWDLGANTGRYSRVAADHGYRVLAFDIDPAAAERHYRSLVKDGRTETTPLVMDLADPSPSLGWAQRERAGLLERANADVVLALALIHHLAIGRNVPLPMVIDLFAQLAPAAIVEWVPRGDPMVDRLLASREDIFDTYTEAGFVAAAERRFSIASRTPIEGSPRVLFELRRNT